MGPVDERSRPLIGVTTSEMRRGEARRADAAGRAAAQGDGARPRLPARDRGGGRPAARDPADAVRGGRSRWSTRLAGVCLSGGPDLDPRSLRRGAAPRARARPSRSSTASSWRSRARPHGRNAADPRDLPRGAGLNVATGGTLVQHLPDGDRRHRRAPPGGPGRAGHPRGRAGAGGRARRTCSASPDARWSTPSTTRRSTGSAAACSPSAGRRTAWWRRSRHPAATSSSACSGTPSAWPSAPSRCALLRRRWSRRRSDTRHGRRPWPHEPPAPGPAGRPEAPRPTTRSGSRRRSCCSTRRGGRSRSEIDRVLPALAPELGSHVTAETHKSALELRTRRAHRRGRRSRPSWRTCARALDGAARARSACAPPARGTHPFAVWQEIRVSTGARYQHVYDSMRELARREPTFALHVHVGVALGGRGDRADEPDARRTCRCCWRCRPTRPSGRAATPALRRRARRSSRRSRGWGSRGRSATTPTGSTRSTCCCAARRSPSPPSSGGTSARSRASAPSRCGSWTRRAPSPRPSALDALVQCIARLELEEGYMPPEVLAAPGAARGEPLHRRARRHGRAHAGPGPRAARARARLQLDLLLEACLPHAHALGCAEELLSVRALADGIGAARQLELARGPTGCPGWCRQWPRCSRRTLRPAPRASPWPGVRRPAGFPELRRYGRVLRCRRGLRARRHR